MDTNDNNEKNGQNSDANLGTIVDETVENNRNINNSYTFNSNEEYFEALRNWLEAYKEWYDTNKNFLFLASHSAYLTALYAQFPNVRQISNQTATVPRPNEAQVPINEANRIPREFIIPPIWKRIVAEGIDFFILFFIKLFVTFFIANTFNVLPFAKYDIETLQKTISDNDISGAIDLTVDTFMFEILHRSIVCAFEAYFLAGHVDGKGGATPGKFLMGLRVVSATMVQPVPGRPIDHVLIYPATNLGYFAAFLRALIKNTVILLMFPICFVAYFFSYNRTGYDFICNSIVVELPTARRRN